MPYRRRYKRAYRRRAPMRRMIRKRRRVPAKQRTDGTRFFKLRRLQQITQTTSGSNINLDFPDNPENAIDWGSIQNLFAYYRVAAMKLKWIPSATEFIATSNNTVPRQQPCYVIHDWNSSALSSLTELDYIGFENMQFKNMTHQWVYYRKMQRMNATGSQSWMSNGFYPTEQRRITQNIGVLIPGFQSTGPIGTFVITYYVCAKQRR